MRDYPMLILPLTDEDGGGFLVLFPDCPGCMSDGETPAEAAENGQDALHAWLESRRESGWEVPEPGSDFVPLLTKALAGRTDQEAEFLRSLIVPVEAISAPPRAASG